jgi:hypothetical protein
MTINFGIIKNELKKIKRFLFKGQQSFDSCRVHELRDGGAHPHGRVQLGVRSPSHSFNK